MRSAGETTDQREMTSGWVQWPRVSLPLGLLGFLTVTRVQFNSPIDAPSVPHKGFPWTACTESLANSLGTEVDPIAMVANLCVYLLLASLVAWLPPVARLTGRFTPYLSWALWAGVLVVAGIHALMLSLADVAIVGEFPLESGGVQGRGLALSFCPS